MKLLIFLFLLAGCSSSAIRLESPNFLKKPFIKRESYIEDLQSTIIGPHTESL